MSRIYLGNLENQEKILSKQDELNGEISTIVARGGVLSRFSVGHIAQI